MCIGVPLQVAALEDSAEFALCSDGSARERLDMRLVGPQPLGAWVLAFNGAARRVLGADEAAQIRDALQALQAALHGDGGSIDTLFADLVDREPQLPPHLAAQAGTQ
jgi:hydrogenase assembly chaperone HypC/HupF